MAHLLEDHAIGLKMVLWGEPNSLKDNEGAFSKQITTFYSLVV